MATTATPDAATAHGLANTPAVTPDPDPREVRVVLYGRADFDDPASHQGTTLKGIAERVARLAGFQFAGGYDAATHSQAGGKFYFVPSDTLVGLDAARQLGIAGLGDLFGGVVPHAFIGTKAISHGLVSPDARAPEGWSEDFAARVRPHVLPGYTAFSLDDARRAAVPMLRDGKVRVKEPCGIGGLGQQVVANEAELDAALQALDAGRVAAEGVVLERNLDSVITFSVGQVEIGGLQASYCGTQDLTPNNIGQQVYGGSTLRVVRGTLESLLAHPIEAHLRDAVRAAVAYHAAAVECFPGVLVSRCNYDVAMGTDNGQPRLGVLEQSWRVGGATGAELAALAAFQADPACVRATACTREIYGADAPVPEDADVYFQGEDRNVGALTKYARLESVTDGHT
ncbi:DUF3182 family protein [Cupriavidus agavae]|uniref:Uncharacterized protein DUF3182 n=1 Tax=Cupriavidus agavae TaxID=1001822 RepID=A0A4Q7S0A3_9BURK|nr:DUF3182 family protein [Cupriavidus agavae]RZT39566.1 uncharacterized protein DUF3182 [Cupriavidus agavae]